MKDGRKAIVIRTSDRITFKSCRRKWSWSSHLKANLGSKNLASPLWFGSGIHFALEDYHGYNRFEHPREAFRAYCFATAKQNVRELPSDAMELYEMGSALMSYYADVWLPLRKVDETFWLNGVPQCEVDFEFEVPLHEHPMLAGYAAAHGADCVLYRGTIDRIAIDEFGRLWVVEYKTAKRAEHFHYLTDPQVSTYLWAAQFLYPGYEIAGVIYMQFVKKVPEPPRILATGKISTAQNLVTSSALYRRALVNMYGDETKAPQDNRSFLTGLMLKESEDADVYIQRAKFGRNKVQMATEAQKILLELEDMLNPNLPLYPNPTRDCSRMCSFLSACVSMDDGSDWEYELLQRFSERDQAPETMWRRRLPSPARMHELYHMRAGVPDLEAVQIDIKALPAPDQEAISRGEADIAFTFLGESE